NHLVGVLSFYERAEIKDMISYLKVIHNPDDSISLLRVINTPARGIGKATLETLERVALETGASLWGAIGEAIPRQLLPQRARVALRSFKAVIEDGQAMLAGTYTELVEETALEEEDTPEAYSRVENLRELVNAAMDSRDRGETLDQFLDHAALVSDADAYDERAQITLMTLHAAKGLEFPLVFLCGLEEGLFPHSRTFLHPDDIEEERRLCYVGMTRAMDALILTRAVYRRRYGTDLPEASVPSRFLEEVPAELMENLGTPRHARVSAGDSPARATAVHGERESGHYAYEDEDQSVSWAGRNHRRSQTPSYSGKTYNSIDNIAEFFASRGKKFSMSW